jgi:membrane protease YdiL (CAAX protease family)
MGAARLAFVYFAAKHFICQSRLRKISLTGFCNGYILRIVMKSNVDRSVFSRAFKTHSGQIRAAWVVLMGFAGYFIASVGFPYLFWMGYYALLDYWGVNARNVSQAPEWVFRCIEAAPAVLAVIQNALAVAVVLVILRAIKKRQRIFELHDVFKRVTQCALGMIIGFACAFACAALLLVTGSSRLGWKLSDPHLSIAHMWTAVSIAAGAVGGEFFTRKYIIEALEGRARRGWIYGISIASYVLLYGLDSRTPLSLINWAIMGAALCAMYNKTNRMWMGVGFRFAWQVMIYIIAGFPEAGGGGMYEVYAASRYWLNGGDAGLMNGFIATATLSGCCLFIIRPWKRLPSSRNPYHTPPRSSYPERALKTSRHPTRRQ